MSGREEKKQFCSSLSEEIQGRCREVANSMRPEAVRSIAAFVRPQRGRANGRPRTDDTCRRLSTGVVLTFLFSFGCSEL